MIIKKGDETNMYKRDQGRSRRGKSLMAFNYEMIFRDTPHLHAATNSGIAPAAG